MKYQKKIAMFMRSKNELLETKNIYGFITDEIIDDILGWPDVEAKRVWNELIESIDNGTDGVGNHTCPYCIKLHTVCDNCVYGKVNGCCFDKDSWYYKNILSEYNYNEADRIITNNEYKEILGNI